MENIINQIKSIRPELQGLLECEVDIRITNNDTFILPRVIGETVEIPTKTPICTVAMAIEIAYALQAVILSRHFPEQRLACYILARQLAFKYMDSFSKTERDSYRAFLAEYSVNEFYLLRAYQVLCNEKASPEKKAHCLGTHLIKQHFPDENANPLDDAVNLAVLAWPLACPTHILLTLGGDDRLHLSDETGTNKYYVAPFPQNDVIIRSSCTSSPPTVSGFVAAELLRQKLLRAALKKELSTTFAMSMKNLRNRITYYFKINKSDAFVICTPSGTDAEILITYLALCLSKKRRQLKQQTADEVPLIQNIIVAAGEVGSGTVAACKGQHFSSYAPNGYQVSAGNGIEGVNNEDVEVIALPARNHTGAAQNVQSLEKQLEQLVHESTQNGQIAVLHQVDSSKTGLKVPRLSFLKRLKQNYRDTLIIVVDAAQMRCEEFAVSKFMNAGFCVLSTGSKFLAGAPFSGVLMLPSQEASYLSSCQESIAGLGRYFAKDEADERLTALREKLPTRPNYGLLLRWETALANIEQYVKISSDKRAYIISQWVKQAQQLVEEAAYVNLFFDGVEVESENDDFRPGGSNTIISFTLHPAQNGKPGRALDTQSLKAVYQWMTKDISAWLPDSATVDECFVAKQQCLIGQPVTIGEGQSEFGMLRIALSAPMVCRMAEENFIADVGTGITQELEDDRRVLDKLSLIGKYYHLFEKPKNKQ